LEVAELKGLENFYSQKIVDHFGTDTFRVLSSESARLQEVEGIGKHRAAKIKQAWDSQFAIRDIMTFLQTYDATNSLCIKLDEKSDAEK
jgi:exodeoxyribonuclease V alpha subunit